MKPPRRCSPEVRITSSGSGCPLVYRCSAMCSTLKVSASSSRDVPLSACSRRIDRTASAISRRPPYPTATFTCMPSTPDVRASAARRASAAASGSRSRAPTICRCHCPLAARSPTASVMMPSCSATSSGERDRLSVESIQSVTTSTPTSSDHRSSSAILSAPARWPVDASAPTVRAHRRLPSRITPMCRGMASLGKEAARRRSYTPYSRCGRRMQSPRVSGRVGVTVPPRRRRRDRLTDAQPSLHGLRSTATVRGVAKSRLGVTYGAVGTARAPTDEDPLESKERDDDERWADDPAAEDHRVPDQRDQAEAAWIHPRSFGLISLIGDSMVLRCWVISPPFVVIALLRLGWVLVCGSPRCTYGTVGYP